jgi:hypothetical protein
VGHGLLIHEVSVSHTTTHHSRQDSSERGVNSSQRPLPNNTQHSQQTDVHAPARVETTISAGERPQTYAVDRAATGTCEITFPTLMEISFFFRTTDICISHPYNKKICSHSIFVIDILLGIHGCNVCCIALFSNFDLPSCSLRDEPDEVKQIYNTCLK